MVKHSLYSWHELGVIIKVLPIWKPIKYYVKWSDVTDYQYEYLVADSDQLKFIRRNKNLGKLIARI